MAAVAVGLERTEVPARGMAPCRTSFAVAAAVGDVASVASCNEARSEVVLAFGVHYPQEPELWDQVLLYLLRALIASDCPADCSAPSWIAVAEAVVEAVGEHTDSYWEHL